ncbi:hypothetical protein GJ689_19300 [Rhodoplanes serenus]|uniref:Uncharacterized protein n=1 Tax=Rhodoplanes serenus TaxID=200615 RepID=A0A9X4XPF4_9BRAD|nr:phage tail tube protein [Rhodoplanes serenus]MTW18352.1 hypothetical protein [Rhodoplanes serenus]
MARARGANATLAAAFESTYGTPPASGFRRMPFVSCNIGEEQGLIESDLLGFGREPQTPTYDVVTNTGEIVVPVDVRNIGLWLRGLMGAPATAAAVAATGTIALAANLVAGDSVTVDGTAFTAVASGATGNQFNLGGTAALTATNLAAKIDPLATVAAAAVGAVITVTASALGPAGNAITLAISAPTRVTLSGATLVGGANTHTWNSGAQTLPSLALEVQLPDVPFFGMTYGARINSFQVQAQRSGLLSASLAVLAQGETVAAAAAAGTLVTDHVLERFGQFQGEVRRNTVALGNVVSAELTYANNLDPVEVIRTDGRIADCDPGILAVTGTVTTRFEDRTLLDQATNRQPCELQFRWTAGAGASLVWTLHRVFLPRGDRQIQGPGGIQVPAAFQAAVDPVLGRAATCVLTNDVASY